MCRRLASASEELSLLGQEIQPPGPGIVAGRQEAVARAAEDQWPGGVKNVEGGKPHFGDVVRRSKPLTVRQFQALNATIERRARRSRRGFGRGGVGSEGAREQTEKATGEISQQIRVPGIDKESVGASKAIGGHYRACRKISSTIAGR